MRMAAMYVYVLANSNQKASSITRLLARQRGLYMQAMAA